MNNDLISRSALEKEIFGPGSYDTYEELLDAVRKAIDNAPAVERPKGEWIYKNYHWVCDKCWDSFMLSSDFCPHCGADMRKGSVE